jgi:hypothetical protein
MPTSFHLRQGAQNCGSTRRGSFCVQTDKIVRVLIYFALRRDDTVELQHVEVIEEEMRAKEVR